MRKKLSFTKRSLFKSFLFIIVTSYIGILLLLTLIQGKLVFHPTPDYNVLPDIPFETVNIKTSSSINLKAWFFPQKNPDFTVLFCHGNAGNISNRLHTVDFWRALNCQILLFDYEGYGKSEGNPNEKGCYQDGLAALHWLENEKKCLPEKILIHGRSLGAAIALQTEINTSKKPAGLIMESAFLSIPDMAKKLYPFLPVRWLCNIKFDNAAKIRLIKIPILIIHSEDDEMIPFFHGEKLYELANFPKHFCKIKGSHNYGFLLSENVYRKSISSFLKQLQRRRQNHVDINK